MKWKACPCIYCKAPPNVSYQYMILAGAGWKTHQMHLPYASHLLSKTEWKLFHCIKKERKKQN